MTKTNSDPNTLLAELTALLRLTRTEAQIARVRIAQARREDIRRELVDNAREADVRARHIQASIRRLGGVPDVFAEAIGRVSAMTKATFEQAQPFSEGLLGDLALEHQLRDRAVFARVLAQAQDQQSVVSLMHELEQAHTETIEWITVRLAEVAQGGPVALSPTPTQTALSTVTRMALLPTRRSADLINKTMNLIQRGRAQAEQAVASTRDRLSATTKATGQVIGAGRNAALARAEAVAPSSQVRNAVHETRKDLGTIDARDLPIKGYDKLSVGAAAKAINKLASADDVRLVLRYEQAHKNRKGVLTAAQQRTSGLAEQSVNT